MAKAGRTKGTPNRKSGLLMRKLEIENKFFVIKELLEIYGWNKDILKNLVEKMYRNMEMELNPMDGFTDNEVVLYNNTNKEVLQMLQRFLAYMYPKLKALEVNTGVGDKVVFNINALGGTGTMEKPIPPQLPPNVVPLEKQG